MKKTIKTEKFLKNIDFIGYAWYKIQKKIFFEENASTYVEIDDNLLILSDGKTILRTSEADGYNHIYQLGFDGKTTQITKGNWDVVEFLGINEKTKTLFRSANPFNKSSERIDRFNTAHNLFQSEQLLYF